MSPSSNYIVGKRADIFLQKAITNFYDNLDRIKGEATREEQLKRLLGEVNYDKEELFAGDDVALLKYLMSVNYSVTDKCVMHPGARQHEIPSSKLLKKKPFKESFLNNQRPKETLLYSSSNTRKPNAIINTLQYIYNKYHNNESCMLKPEIVACIIDEQTKSYQVASAVKELAVAFGYVNAKSPSEIAIKHENKFKKFLNSRKYSSELGYAILYTALLSMTIFGIGNCGGDKQVKKEPVKKPKVTQPAPLQPKAPSLILPDSLDAKPYTPDAKVLPDTTAVPDTLDTLAAKIEEIAEDTTAVEPQRSLKKPRFPKRFYEQNQVVKEGPSIQGNKTAMNNLEFIVDDSVSIDLRKIVINGVFPKTKDRQQWESWLDCIPANYSDVVVRIVTLDKKSVIVYSNKNKRTEKIDPNFFKFDANGKLLGFDDSVVGAYIIYLDEELIPHVVAEKFL